MSIWSWFSRRPPLPISRPTEPDPRPIFTDTDREFVRSALDRFETSGLRIRPELDRDLIVARALVDIDRWQENEATLQPALQALFLALAAETDSLTWHVDDMQEQYPPLAEIDDDAAEDLLATHSPSIFVNAGSINLVNEDNALDRMVRDFAALGDIKIAQVELRPLKNGNTNVSFEVDGIGTRRFEIENLKHPDVTPAFTEMNRIAIAKGLGRYINVPEGSSESDTFILADETAIPAIIALLELKPDGVNGQGL
jgi:hypothetical protein